MSSRRYKTNPLVLIGIPTLEPRPVSWDWLDALGSLQFPLGAATARMRIHGEAVANARNAIAKEALRLNADYVLFLGDDVIPPPNLFGLLHRHRKEVVTGVYWTRTYPTQPYLWDGLLKGPYVDWKVGEFFPIDMAGCDALLVLTDVFRAIEFPWFSQDWVFEPEEKPISTATEDFYFYTKVKAAGYQLWVDTEAQCRHQDRNTGVQYGLSTDMPQCQKDAPPPSEDPTVRVADVGAGNDTPWFGANAHITRYDIDPATKPDVRCDVRAIPEKDEVFDIVHCRHVLEHFMWDEAPALITEWARILKVGGELRINVPNLAYAAREILKADADSDYDAGLYPLWQLYGKHVGSYGEVHRNGFTQHGLRRLLESCGLEGVQVAAGGEFGENLHATARKGAQTELVAIGPILRACEEQGASQNGSLQDGATVAGTAGPLPQEAMSDGSVVFERDTIEKIVKSLHAPERVGVGNA